MLFQFGTQPFRAIKIKLQRWLLTTRIREIKKQIETNFVNFEVILNFDFFNHKNKGDKKNRLKRI